MLNLPMQKFVTRKSNACKKYIELRKVKGNWYNKQKIRIIRKLIFKTTFFSTAY